MTTRELEKRIDALEDDVEKVKDALRFINPKSLETKSVPHEFKVGDRVQFKSWEEMEKEFGLIDGDINCYYYFTKNMKDLCGTYATVSCVLGEYVELKDFTTSIPVNTLGWNYSRDMLKPATDELKCKFKVGDKVKVVIGVDNIINNQVATVNKTNSYLDYVPLSYFVDFDNENLDSVWVSERYLEPYTEPRWTFTDDEKVILRNLPEEYKWIAKDEGGILYIFTNKPKKRRTYRNVHDGDAIFADFYSHLFQTIKWTDEEPCEFSKYL